MWWCYGQYFGEFLKFVLAIFECFFLFNFFCNFWSDFWRNVWTDCWTDFWKSVGQLLGRFLDKYLWNVNLSYRSSEIRISQGPPPQIRHAFRSSLRVGTVYFSWLRSEISMSFDQVDFILSLYSVVIILGPTATFKILSELRRSNLFCFVVYFLKTSGEYNFRFGKSMSIYTYILKNT